jgi:MraZ protein
MFYGEFDYKLDEKGRLMIPPKFRSVFKDGIVLTSSAENCITGYTTAEWKKLSASMTGSPLARSKMRRLNRAIFATAFSTTIDGQGRVAIPAPLRDQAQIMDDAVVVGVNTYLEIWNKTLWEEEKTISQQQAWQIIESLEPNE